MTTSPAGWYPAEQHPGRQRYWDGDQWTDHFHPPLDEAPAVPPVTAAEVTQIAAASGGDDDVVAILTSVKNDAIAAGMLTKHKVTSKANKRRQEVEANFTARLKTVKNYWVKIDVIKTPHGISWSPDNGVWSKDGASRGGKMGLANELSAGGGMVSGLVGNMIAGSVAKAAAKDAQRAQMEYAAFESAVLSNYYR
ncbi:MULTISPECIES: DUF2510 domain-containing protein [unclassified Microbacterium]|uniref:DUF2510 domain-containing protein n=1 Tax=unclassified Microbacterium TaxID=2609290 RepID=UPI001D6EE151|nr:MULTISPECIES: DUF2510 domain-containing protein [unclassified Microbacterium]CAH0211727.1 hypothetical protein SRABI121_02744 [Microbacterium sp. Bi121]HWK77647.1 DUF2510 domain-containing protein [Microbacterium sp.]